MTALQEEFFVYAMVVTLIVVALIGHICIHAPVWDQEEEEISGTFYVNPEGVDHG